MEIQPIVIGTAGHIDHGKSTLVRALTGIDPDRLKEEKERGLTIDLGFARMELPDGRWVGIVDVPGHERFIRNMVAGATGIDMVVLVVAADDGVMPQTREHLAIMQLLGVERGFVALTKIDLVDEDMVELAEEDVLETVRGTFLDGTPVLRVSAIRGDGMDELRGEIARLATACEPRSEGGLFRMPVQRVFSARGFGTIVTGIPLSGAVEVGDVVELVPGARKSKVRGIQAYHESTSRARAGHSTALNLSDADQHDVERGHVVATPGFFQPATMLGARLGALPDLDRVIANRMPVRVHTGTAEALGEVVLLDVQELQPGETALVQLRLQRPLVCAPGDKFVLRLASPLVTLGGGEILESSRYRLKRFKPFVVADLERQVESLGSVRDTLAAVLARWPERWATGDELAVQIKQSRADTRSLLKELGAQGSVLAPGSGNRWIHAEVLEFSLQELDSAIETWFSEHPLRERIDVRDMRRLSGFEAPFAAMLLDESARRGRLELLPGGFVRPAGRHVALDAESAALRERMLVRLVESRFQPPTASELVAALGTDEAHVQTLLALLVDQGAVEHLGAELYLARECLEEARAEVMANCEEHGHLEIPSLRDRLGTSRKFLIPLLEHFDAVGVTLRQGGHRVLKRG